MRDKNLKSRALNAILWSALQSYGSYIIAFVTNIILARMLSPDDFGIIGLLTVFIAIANSITESGFNSALIQRNEVTQTDYCTIFYWNICVSIVLVISFYWLAPIVAVYFERPILTKILRVESIILIFNSLCMVQTTRLMKFLKFKILAIRSIMAVLVASCVGIILAYRGMGVWALVWQNITNSAIGAILLWSVSGWKPSLLYKWDSFKKMFNFGFYIFISSITYTLYQNIQSFIIGKAFSIKDLGYYTQAKKIETIAVDTNTSIINRVLFPVYSQVATDRQHHISIVRKNVTLLTYITFPLMCMLILIAEPLFILLFTEKWIPAVPMFQILCIAGLIAPLNMANVEIFRSIGNGRIYLTLQMAKRIMGIIIILCFIPFGLYPMIWSMTVISIVSYSLNLYFTNKYFGYTIKEQVRDIMPNLILSIVAFIVTYILKSIFNSESIVVEISIGILPFVLIYILGSMIFRYSGLNLICDLIRSKHV